jgi:hypothetical protein
MGRFVMSFYRKLNFGFIGLAFAMLASCGDGGGGSTPTPTPAPTPTPSPTPTPTPTPTPSAAGRAFGTNAHPCFLYLYSTKERTGNDPQFSGLYCDRDGRFGQGSGAILAGAAFGTMPFRDFTTAHALTAGPDNPSSMFMSYVAPLGSRTFSPTTSLIEWASSQTAVKTALGLDNGVFSLTTNPDLTNYDVPTALASSDAAVKAEGARVAAANLRAMALAVSLDSLGAVDPYSLAFPQYRTAGEWIGGRNGFLFENARMSALLNSVAGTRLRPEVISAAAHLIDAYAAAIPVQVADTTTAAQYTLGIFGYLRFELSALAQANTVAAANSALAVTSPQIISATQIYREYVPFPTSGRFFPAPNFFSTTGQSLSIRADLTGISGSTGSLMGNDLYANGTEAAIGFFPSSSTVLSVTVPASKSSQVSATLAGGLVTVTALNAFRGTTYFDYAVRHPSGEQGTSRVYVNFR